MVVILFKEKEKKQKPKVNYLQIRLKDGEREALKETAKKYNMTVTDLVKNAVNEYVKKRENN